MVSAMLYVEEAVSEVTCARCERKFSTARTTAKYCSDQCRGLANSPGRKREETLAKQGGKCADCGAKHANRWFLRLDKVLCGRCNSALSRKLFYERVPEPGRGYASRVLLERTSDE